MLKVSPYERPPFAKGNVRLAEWCVPLDAGSHINAKRTGGLYRAKRRKGHPCDASCYAMLDISPLLMQ